MDNYLPKPVANRERAVHRPDSASRGGRPPQTSRSKKRECLPGGTAPPDFPLKEARVLARGDDPQTPRLKEATVLARGDDPSRPPRLKEATVLARGDDPSRPPRLKEATVLARGDDPSRPPRSKKRPSLRQHAPQDLLHLVEMLLAAGQRRGELDDRVAAVVGAADQAGVEQGRGQEAAQQPLRLVVAERLARNFVLDQLDPVEVPVAADVADDRQVSELLERRAEPRLAGPDVAEQVLLLEDVQVGE